MSAGSATSIQENSAQSLAKNLETVTKASVIAVALLYGLGLLVTNEYLITIGVSDFTSVRPKYIVTGVWVLSIVAATFIPILFPLLARERRMAGKIGSAAVGTVVAWLSLIFVMRVLGVPELREIWKPLTLLLCCSCAICFQTWFLRKVLVFLPISALTIVLLGCFGGITMTFIVAKKIYPKVPEALGGGKPISGRIILNKEGAEFWLDAGVEKSDPSKKTDDTFEDTARSRSVKILYQDEHVMVIDVQTTRVTPKLGETGNVKSTQTRTMLLNKSLVDAVIIDSTWQYSPSPQPLH